ncbi:MAG: DUF3604 domain-containing protein [Xanthomonadales bacterium]
MLSILYDVVGSDQREIRLDCRDQAVGNTVNVQAVSYASTLVMHCPWPFGEAMIETHDPIKEIFEMMNKSATIAVILTFTLLAAHALAQNEQVLGVDFAVSKDNVPQKAPIYSPYVGQSHPNRVFWGDTHVHTSYSWDAGLVGNTLGPDEAYRFAKGQQVIASSGQPAKLVRPLDWLVVADHAESLGVAVLIERSDPAILKSDIGRQTHDLYKKGDIFGAFQNWGFNVIIGGNDPLKDPEFTRSVWGEIIDYAEAHNQPGAFTAFIGYEWSSSPAGNNLHRVVVMRDDADEARQVLPFGATDSSDPEDLWRWMAGYEQKTGGRVLAIAHNGNISNGAMFATETLSGKRINRDYKAEIDDLK